MKSAPNRPDPARSGPLPALPAASAFVPSSAPSSAPLSDMAAQLAALAADPARAHLLQELQIRFGAAIMRIADKTAEAMRRQDQEDHAQEGADTMVSHPQSPAQSPSVAALAKASRQRAMRLRQQRAFALELTIATVVNLGNPDWNPHDPSTSWQPGPDLLAALLTLRERSADADTDPHHPA